MTWRWNAGDGMIVRTVCFSDDGSRILTGTVKHVYLFSTGSNESKDIPWADEWIRNCAFFGDSFVVGSTIVGWFDSGANKVWEYNMGEFPLFMGTDQYGNTFAGGKSRTLFSFSKGGTLMWKTRIPDHTITTGAMTPDGSRILIGTIGGMVYLFDGNGNLLWKRATLEQAGGHHRHMGDISPDEAGLVLERHQHCIHSLQRHMEPLLWKTAHSERIQRLLEAYDVPSAASRAR
jgi:WD40 repeat protein